MFILYDFTHDVIENTSKLLRMSYRYKRMKADFTSGTTSSSSSSSSIECLITVTILNHKLYLLSMRIIVIIFDNDKFVRKFITRRWSLEMYLGTIVGVLEVSSFFAMRLYLCIITICDQFID